MTPQRLLLSALFLAAVAGCSCDPEIKQSTGIFELTPKAIDFGKSCVNDTNERTLLLRNLGNTPLDIQDIAISGAGFTLLDEDELPAFLDGGQEVVLRIGFSPAAATQFPGKLTVVTDAAENGTQAATLVGLGAVGKNQDFRVECPSTSGTTLVDCLTLDLGGRDGVLGGQSKSAVVHLKNEGCGRLEVNEARLYAGANDDSGGEDVKLFALSGQTFPLTLRGGETRELTVQFNAPREEKVPDVRLKLASNDPETKKFSWPQGEWDVGLFSRSVAPALNVDPDVLTYFDALDGVPLARTFRVENRGSSPLRVDSVQLHADGGSTNFQLGAGDAGPFTLEPTGAAGGEDTREITVTFLASGPTKASGKVVVTTANDAAEVRLLGGLQPQLEVTWVDPVGGTERPPPVDFGETVTGTKDVQRTVRLHNVGRAKLTVSKVDVPADTDPGRSFSTGGFAGDIAPGAFEEVVVTFNDAVLMRDDRGKLRVVSNDPLDEINGGAHLVDLVSQNEPNFAPTPQIDITPGATSCKTVTLDASGSASEPGDSLSFEWTLPRKPSGSTTKVEDSTAMVTRLVSTKAGCLEGPDINGSYTVKVRVTDQFGSAAEADKTFTVR